MLEEQLSTVARQAMDNPHLVRIDHATERLLIGLPIHERQQEFLDFYRRQTGAASPTLLGALLHLAGGMRRQWLNGAVGYKVGVIPFDRRLNRWMPDRPEAP